MNRIGLVMVALVVAMLAPSFVQAQDQGGRRGNFDPAQFREQRLNRVKEQLGANDDEWKVLQPKISKVMEVQMQSFGGGGFGRGGRGGGDNQPTTPVARASAELRTTLENKDAPADEIAKKLTALREAREKARAELQAAQKELKEVLTQRQEAVLVTNGMLE
jgi:hypothetical protein